MEKLLEYQMEENPIIIEPSKIETKTFSDTPKIINQPVKTEPKILNIKSNFINIDSIGYVFNATGETNTTSIIGGKLRMMQGRTYYIPVNSDVNSDNYTIKVLSNIAAKIDVRFVRDGYACVVPIHHNTIITDKESLCTLVSN